MSTSRTNTLHEEDPPINGYELVKKILAHEGDTLGIARLISLANNHETEWLEFKASIQLAEEEKEQKLKKNGIDILPYELEAQFHIAKAVISMLNSHGGAVIIGITDTHEVIGWEGCLESLDSKTPKDPEKFIRTELFDQIIFPKQWILPKHTEELVHPSKNMAFFRKEMKNNYVHARRAEYKDKQVLVLLIKPLGRDLYPLLLKTRWTNNKWKSWHIESNIAKLDNIIKSFEHNFSIFQSCCAEASGKLDSDVLLPESGKIISEILLPEIKELRKQFDITHAVINEIKKQFNIQLSGKTIKLLTRSPGDKGETICTDIAEVFRDLSPWTRAPENNPDRYKSIWESYKKMIEIKNRPEPFIMIMTIPGNSKRYRIHVNDNLVNKDDKEKIHGNIIECTGKKKDSYENWFIEKKNLSNVISCLEEKLGEGCCTRRE